MCCSRTFSLVRSPWRLPAVVREGLVGLRHAVRVFTLLDRRAALVCGVEQLARQAFSHRVFRPRTRAVDQPPDRQSLGRVRTDLDRNLVGRTADAARPDFQMPASRCPRHRETPEPDRPWARPSTTLQRAIDDRFRDRLLAVQHQTIHKLCEDAVAILGIRQNLALLRATTTRHLSGSPYFGRFAPYFDRRCRRSFTPWVSSEPRMM